VLLAPVAALLNRFFKSWLWFRFSTEVPGCCFSHFPLSALLVKDLLAEY